MAEEDHPIITKLKQDRCLDPDTPDNEVFRTEALMFALQPPTVRAQAIRDLNEQMFNPRDRHTGEFLEDRTSCGRRPSSLAWSGRTRTAHERLKAAVANDRCPKRD